MPRQELETFYKVTHNTCRCMLAIAFTRANAGTRAGVERCCGGGARLAGQQRVLSERPRVLP
jgi:hypothetical protein